MQNTVPVHEGKPQGPISFRWLRLAVRAEPTVDDVEAERLLREFGKNISSSDYRDEFTLSVFRIPKERVEGFDFLPKIEDYEGCKNIEGIQRFLNRYARDLNVPMVI